MCFYRECNALVFSEHVMSMCPRKTPMRIGNWCGWIAYFTFTHEPHNSGAGFTQNHIIIHTKAYVIHYRLENICHRYLYPAFRHLNAINLISSSRHIYAKLVHLSQSYLFRFDIISEFNKSRLKQRSQTEIATKRQRKAVPNKWCLLYPHLI